MKKLWDERESKRQIENGYSKDFAEFLSNWYSGVLKKSNKMEQPKTLLDL